MSGIIKKDKEFFKYDLKLINESIANLLVEKQIHFLIGGGCFTSQFSQKQINDIDVFFKDEENLKKALELLGENELGEKNYEEYTIGFDNDWVRNIYKGKTKIQFVKKYFYENAEQMFNAFDFTCVKFAYDGLDCFYNERFFIDLSAKKLVIDNISFLSHPLSTLQRSYKYASRGFGICPFGMAAIAKRIHELKIDWDNPDENVLNFYNDGTPKFQGLD